MYSKILVPLDGSDLAEKALPHAKGLAKAYGATIHLIQVFTQHPSGSSSVREGPDLAGLTGRATAGMGGSNPNTLVLARQLREAQIGEASEYLQQVATQLKKESINVETELHEGSPHEHISEYAKQHSIDIIVMSTHGHGGFKRLITGSTTDRVIRSGEANVLVVA